MKAFFWDLALFSGLPAGLGGAAFGVLWLTVAGCGVVGVLVAVEAWGDFRCRAGSR